MRDPKPGVDYTVEQIKPRSNGTTAPNGNDGAGASGKGGAATPAGYTPEPWPVLDNATLYGLAGEVVTCLKPHTESDPAALLLQYLTSFGNAWDADPTIRSKAIGISPICSCCWPAIPPKRAKARRPDGSG
jgi:hypothetical protein